MKFNKMKCTGVTIFVVLIPVIYSGTISLEDTKNTSIETGKLKFDFQEWLGPLGTISLDSVDGTSLLTLPVSHSQYMMFATIGNDKWPCFNSVVIKDSVSNIRRKLPVSSLYILVNSTITIEAKLSSQVNLVTIEDLSNRIILKTACNSVQVITLNLTFPQTSNHLLSLHGSNFTQDSNVTLKIINKAYFRESNDADEVINVRDKTAVTIQLSDNTTLPISNIIIRKNCSNEISIWSIEMNLTPKKINCSFTSAGFFTYSVEFGDIFWNRHVVKKKLVSVNIPCVVPDVYHYKVGEKPDLCPPLYGFDYVYDFGQGTGYTGSNYNGQMERILESLPQYNEQGTYTITVNSTLFTNVSTERKVIFQHPLIPSRLSDDVENQVLVPPGLVNFEVDVVNGSDFHAPTDVSCQVSDDSNTHYHRLNTSNISVDGTRWLQFNHTYTNSGTYNVQLSCLNNVSEIVANTTIIAMEFSAYDVEVDVPNFILMNDTEDTNLTLTFQLKLLTKPPPKLYYGVTTSPKETYNFQQMVSIEHNVTFHNRQENTLYIFLRYYLSHKYFHKTVRSGVLGFNKIDTETKGGRNVTVFMFEVVMYDMTNTVNVMINWDDGSSDEVIEFTANSQTTAAQRRNVSHVFQEQALVTPKLSVITPNGREHLHLNDTLLIQNSFSEALTDVKSKYSYNDTVRINFWGTGKTYPIQNAKCILKEHRVYFYQHVYSGQRYAHYIRPSAPGNKSLTVICFNNVSEATTTYFYRTVCFASAILFEGNHSSPENSLKMFAHVPQYITGRPSQPCINASTLSYEWSIVNASGAKIPILQVENSYRLSPQKYLTENGLYKLSLNVSIPDTPEYMTDEIWLEYTVELPVGKITGGSEKRIGKGDILELDAETNSYDPRLGFGKPDPELRFEWECYVINEYERVQEYLQMKPSTGEKVKDETSCPVKIPAIGRTTMDSSLLQVNTWALIRLRVKKGSMTTFTFQGVEVLSQSPPVGNIICVLNCEVKFATDAISKFTVEIKCPTCSENQIKKMKYKWTVFKYDPETKQNVKQHWSDKITSKDTNNHFYSDRDAFEEGYNYLFRVEMTCSDKPTGVTTYRFSTNTKPYGGKCSIAPTAGLAFEQDFLVSCSGWKDEGIRHAKDASVDIKEPLTYIVTQFVGEEVVVVSTGEESVTPKFQLQLCPSEDNFICKIEIRICDRYLSCSSQYFNVTVKSPFSELITSGLTTNANSSSGLASTTPEERISMFTSAIDKLTANIDDSFGIGLIPTEKVTLISALSTVLMAIPTLESAVETTNVAEVKNPSSASSAMIDGLKKLDLVRESLREGMDKLLSVLLSSVKSDLVDGALQMADILKFSTSIASSISKPDIITEKSQKNVMDTAEYLSKTLLKNALESRNENEIKDAMKGLMNLQNSMINIGAPELANELDEDGSHINEPEVKDDGFNGIELKYFKNVKSKKKMVEARKRLKTARKNIEVNEKIWENTFTMLEKFSTSKGVELIKKYFTLKFHKGQFGEILDSLNNKSETFDSNGVSMNVEDAPVSLDTDLKLKTVVMKKNIYIQGANSPDINCPVVKVAMSTVEGNEAVLPKQVKVAFKDPKSPTFKRVVPEFILGDASGFFYQKTFYKDINQNLCVQVQPEIDSVTYDFYWRSLQPPNDLYYDMMEENIEREEDGKTIVACLEPGIIKRRGNVYVGMKPRIVEPGDVLTRKRRTANDTASTTANSGNRSDDERLTSPFLINVQGVSCMTWSDDQQDWQHGDCQVERNSVKGETTCKCRGKSENIISSSFVVAPNAIDFTTVFSKFDIKSQQAVLGCIIVVLVLSFLLGIWGRWKDSFDVLEWGVTVLEDNFVEDSYFYLITVYTGFIREGSTMSNVSFHVLGESAETDIRQLSDGVRKGFKAGSVMHFLMAVPNCLGNLQYLRIWHDNSGKGKYASWNLNRVEIVDIQTNERSLFMCNSWLSVEEGTIDKVLPLCGTDNMKNFKTLFFEHAKNHITDDHIWLSVLIRPIKSHFSRVQRVCCCATLLFLTMITNAMFFTSEKDLDRRRTSSIELGPIKFNPSQIYISLISVCIIAIPVYVIVVLFRKSKQKPREREEKKIPTWLPRFIKKKLEFSQKLEKVLVIGDNVLITEAVLPFWCAYIAWVIALITSFISIFFILLYSMQWGKDISEEWLTTFFISFFQSFLLVDPVKVLILSVVASILLVNFKSSRPTKYDLLEIKEFTTKSGKTENARRQISSRPAGLASYLQNLRIQKQRDEQMKTVIREFILNVFFLFLLSCILYSNRDTMSYNLHTYITDNFLNPPLPNQKYDQLKRTSDYFNWLENTVMPSLFPEVDYTGDDLISSDRLFTYNSPNLRVGPPRLRQSRSSNETCSYPYIGSVFCIPSYDILNEETGGYCPGWTQQPCSDQQEVTLTIDAWKFTPADDIWGIPIAGLIDLYGGGGYIANLDINKVVCQISLTELFQSLWIDRHTRAIFLEFTLYNVDVNMFTYVSILTEFPASGGLVTFKNVFPFRPTQHLGSQGKFIMVCEIAVLVYLIISVILMTFRFTKQKLSFFLKFWNVVEFAMVCLSAIAIVLFFVRQQDTDVALANLKESNRKFVNFYHVVMWDHAFVTVLGLLVSIATMRLLKAMAYTNATFKVFTVLRITMTFFPGFSIFIAVNLLSFASAGYVLYGRTSNVYRSMIVSMQTMFVGLLGDPTFRTTDAEVHMFTLELVFFSLFVIMVTITASNLFLAMLMDVIARSQEESNEQQMVDYNIFNYMWQSVVHIIRGTSPDCTYNTEKPTKEKEDMFYDIASKDKQGIFDESAINEKSCLTGMDIFSTK